MSKESKQYSLFEITIGDNKGLDYYPVVVEFSKTGNVGFIQKHGQLLLTDEDISKLQEYEDWGEPDNYGQTLGRRLFTDKSAIGEAFNQAGPQRRVYLIVNAPELRGLHWERLAAPIDGNWQMLARNENTPYAISLATGRDLNYSSLQQDEIKALVLVSHPKDLAKKGFNPFDAEKAIKDAVVALSKVAVEIDVLAIEGQAAIDQALNEIKQIADDTDTAVTNQPTLKVTYCGKPTQEVLADTLSRKAYAILHVVAHGIFVSENGQDKTIIFLADDNDHTVGISASELICDLNNTDQLRVPRFAFLVSCESGRRGKTVRVNNEGPAQKGGLGQRLVQEAGLHAVVAMKDKITVVTAEKLAPTFYERLYEHGYPDLALVQAGAGLRRRHDMEDVVPVLFSRLRGQPLYYRQFTDTAGFPLTDIEIITGFERLKTLIDERAPGLKKEFARQHADEARDSEALKRLKSAFTKNQPDWRDMTESVKDWEAWEWLNNICFAIIDFDFVELAQGREAPVYRIENPFPGLKAFGIPGDKESEAAAAYFFGRDGLVDRLLRLLDDHPVLVASGPSGSGKSSVVMAGAVPKLRAEGLACQYMTPGKNPLVGFESAMSANPDVIVVDQFEEIFTLVDDKPEGGQKERAEFIQRMAGWVEETSNRKLILTMRSDFVGEGHVNQTLADWITEYSQTVLPLTASELRDVAGQQAANAFPSSEEGQEVTHPLGLKFDPGLLNRIMNDLQEESGRMPLLQFTLRELWQRRTGRWLRATAYEALGGIDKAIANTAEEIYKSLARDDKELMKYIFIRLTHLDESGGRGQQRRDTRNRMALKDLKPKGKTLDQVEALIYKPELRSLLITTQPKDAPQEFATTTPDNGNQLTQPSGNTEVEVIHEAVIRHWQRLQEWLDRDYEMLRQRQKIQREALEWQNEDDAKKKKSLLLLQGSRLQEIEEWRKKNQLELNTNEDVYVNACIVKERDQIRQSRLKLIGMTLLAVALLIASYQAWNSWQKEKIQTAVGSARKLAAKAQFDAVNGDPVLNTLLNIQILNQFERVIQLDHSLENDIFDGMQSLRYAMSKLPRRMVEMPQSSNIVDLAFTPDSKKLITFNRDGKVHIIDTETVKIINNEWDHPEEGKALVISPNGEWLATRGEKYVSIWNLQSGQKKSLELPFMYFSSLNFNYDGNYVAMVGDNGMAHIWEVNSGKEVYPISHGHGQTIESIAFNPTKNQFVTLSKSMIRLWEIRSNSVFKLNEVLNEGPTNKFFNDEGTQYSYAMFSRDGNKIILANSYFIQVWNSELTKSLYNIVHYVDSKSGFITNISTSHNGKYLGYGAGEALGTYEAVVFDLANGTYIASTLKHDVQISSVDFSNSENQLFLSTGWGGVARILNIENSQETARVLHIGNVLAGALSPDGQWAATAGEQGELILWQPDAGAELRQFSAGEVAYFSGISLDNQVIVTESRSGNNSNKVMQTSWDTVTGQQIRSFEFNRQHPFDRGFNSGFDHPLYSNMLILVEADGLTSLYDVVEDEISTQVYHEGATEGVTNSTNQRLATFKTIPNEYGNRAISGEIHLWDIDSETQTASIVHEKAEGLLFSPEGTFVVTHDRFNMIMWDSKTGDEILRSTNNEKSITDWAFLPNEEVLYISRWGILEMWNIPSRTVNTLDIELSTISVSLDGNYIAFSEDNGNVTVRPTQDINEIKLKIPYRRVAWDTQFSPDGKFLAIARGEQTARVWDINSEEIVAEVTHDDFIHSVDFSSDGHWLITASLADGIIRIWALTPSELIQEACNRLPRPLPEVEWNDYLGDDLGYNSYQDTCSEDRDIDQTVSPWIRFKQFREKIGLTN